MTQKAKKTPLKAAHSLMKEPTDFLDSVIENIPHMIFVKDADELRFVRFNKAGEDLLGYSKAEMIGKNDHDFFPKAEADFFTRKDREVLQSGKLYDIPEEPIHTRKKGIRVLRTKKIPIHDAEGKPIYLLGISEDITDRLRLEREIAAVSDREQRRIGQDLHDGLGQHLTGVAFMTKGLAQKLAGKNLPEAEDAVLIAELVNQSIVMTRNMARVLNPIELEHGGLLKALSDLAANTQRLYKVKCHFETNVPLGFTDKGIVIHLYRIVQEAIDNAIKHGKANMIQINFSKAASQILMNVKDNGAGFPHESEKPQGMGLSNMRYRAKMIGGTLRVEKNPEGGTIVSCLFSARMN